MYDLPQRVRRSQKTTLCSQVSSCAFYKGPVMELLQGKSLDKLSRLPGVQNDVLVETCKML